MIKDFFKRSHRRAFVYTATAWISFALAGWGHVGGLGFFCMSLYGFFISLATWHCIGWAMFYRTWYHKWKDMKDKADAANEKLQEAYEQDQARHMKRMRESNELNERMLKALRDIHG